MGMVFPGIPSDITLQLAGLNASTAFVETGTYRGDTTRWAAAHFEKVFTIEKSEFHYKGASESLAGVQGVRALFGDSRTVLPQVVAELGAARAVVFLDGHWSGGHTAGADDECPLLDELASLEGRENDIILIDDARLFHCPPPAPHDPAQWPSIGVIVDALQRCQKKPYIAIVDDVIFSIPDHKPLTDCLIRYAQDRSDIFWRTYRSGVSFPNHILGGLSSIKQRITG